MTRADLEADGFVGWIPLTEAHELKAAPRLPGVYAVLYPLDSPAVWPGKSSGGWHKGRDPAVSEDVLRQNWVDGSEIVYIGMTERTLAKRISEFSRFGRGLPVAHWGGRLVWQLPDVEALSIGWLPLEPASARAEESRLLQEFVSVFGRLPFANLKR